jgi:hypothetical protein
MFDWLGKKERKRHNHSAQLIEISKVQVTSWTIDHPRSSVILAQTGSSLGSRASLRFQRILCNSERHFGGKESG